MRNSARRRVAAAASIALVGLALGPLPDSLALAELETLPLGDADLVETRDTETLAPGVELTRIVRGSEPTPESEIQTTTRGPWRVNVLTIDPSAAAGHLSATYGPDLGQREKTTQMVDLSGALVGVNGSFTSLLATHPGKPVGLSIHDGKLLSEPAVHPGEVDLVVDATTNEILVQRLDWSGQVRNRRTGARLGLEHINRKPGADGGLVRFDPELGGATPAGSGAEVVLGPKGCVLRRSSTRGTTLQPTQTSLQATGSEASALMRMTMRGCLKVQTSLFDESGEQLVTHPGLFAVSGRYRLTRAGQTVTTVGPGEFFDRNARTIAGTTSDGTIVLATIDGDQSSSVGATMQEAADVAGALGLHESVNLDGGGSTAMSLRGELVNQPSDEFERNVGDALVYVEPPPA